MKKKIAIPMENGKLCAHFGHCQTFVIVTVNDELIEEITEVIPPEHKPGVYPRWIAGFQVTEVIAGGIGQKAIELFKGEQINVFAGAPVAPARQLVEDYLNGNLSLVANYCNHNHKSHTGQCHH